MSDEQKPELKGRGGPGRGGGRKPGSVNKLAKDSIVAAKATGILPHEWLLNIVRGEPIEQRRWKIELDENGKEVGRELVTELIYPDLPMRQDSAKVAAPFYAPKLAAQTVDMNATMGVHKLSDEELDAKLMLLAKQLVKDED